MFSSLLLLVVLTVLPSSVLGREYRERKEPLPHILFVVIDDLGSNDLGYHRTSGIHTPFIDQLIREGTLLENYYVLPYCSPTRAAFLTGRYPQHTGVHGVLHNNDTVGIPLDEETLAEVLAKAGYQTHIVGKWHVGHSRYEQTPTFRGFRSFYGLYLGGQDYFTHYKWGPPIDNVYDMHYDRSQFCGEGCSQLVDERGNYSTDVFTREATRVIREHKARESATEPLFLYLAHQGVHWPNQVPERYTKPYKNRTDWSDQRITYAGMLSAIDESMQLVVDELKKHEMWENTLTIVTTDNGGPTAVCAIQGSSNYPKRGGKCTLYEGGTTGDGFITGPVAAKISSHKHYRNLFHAVDWLPTLAEIVGAKPEGKPLDGVSHLSSMQSDEQISPRDEIYIGYVLLPDHYIWYGPAVRYRNWKLIQGRTGGPESAEIIPEGSSVPPKGGEDIDYLLFDLDNDPSETHNVALENPLIVQMLQNKLRHYQKSFVPPNEDPSCIFPDADFFSSDIFGLAWKPWCSNASEVIIYT